MKSIQEIFPRASKSFVDANTETWHPLSKENNVHGNVTPLHVKRGRMNKTEAEFALVLEAMKRKGEILRYEFEGITLRFAGVKYTPDFVVVSQTKILTYTEELFPIHSLKFIEVKGPFIRGNRERAVERFRHAKTYWKEFTFEMHQKTHDGWKQII